VVIGIVANWFYYEHFNIPQLAIKHYVYLYSNLYICCNNKTWLISTYY